MVFVQLGPKSFEYRDVWRRGLLCVDFHAVVSSLLSGHLWTVNFQQSKSRRAMCTLNANNVENGFVLKVDLR